jgi:hypothetical protein
VRRLRRPYLGATKTGRPYPCTCRYYSDTRGFCYPLKREELRAADALYQAYEDEALAAYLMLIGKLAPQMEAS